MKECDNCLFFVNPMPDTIICIRGKRIKELENKKTNCKNWVENTCENAEKELKAMKGGETWTRFTSEASVDWLSMT